MRAYFKNRMKKGSIFLKITLLFEVVLILTVILLSDFMIHRYSTTLKEKEIILGNINVGYLAEYMREKYERVYDLAHYMHNGTVTEIMTSIDSDSQQIYEYTNISQLDGFAAATMAADSDISDIILVSVNGEVYSQSKKPHANIRIGYSFIDEKRTQDFLKSDMYIDVYYDDPTAYCLGKRENVFSFMGKIYDSSLFPTKKVVGIYIINVPVSEIQKNIVENETMKGELSVLNQHGETIYHTSSEWIGAYEKEYEMAGQEIAYFTEKSISNSGLRVKYTLSDQSLYAEIKRLNQDIRIVLIFAILLTLIICYGIYRVYDRRIKELLLYMDRIEQEDFHCRIPVKSQDEIGVISTSFNNMCERLDNYVSRVYREEVERKNAELNALQTQINPHFLYNTLECIRAKALSENDKITAEMITLLGKMFRWSCRTDEKCVILEEELEYVRTYLKLQSFRYSTELDVCIQVDEEIMDYVVPKLLLQPIIENVINHAFLSFEYPGLAGITVKKKKENLEITIYDNGCGIQSEKLRDIKDKLNRDEKQDEFHSIGIQNVHQRVRLLFGKPYGLQIRSIEGKGTAVKIVLPALNREEMDTYVQNVNHG